MPLPARRSRATSPSLAPNAAAELQALEAEFGGRSALVTALTFAPPSPSLQYLLGLVADPDHTTTPLARLLELGRILPGELAAALAAGGTIRSRLLAHQHIARRTPTVVAEVMHKAAEHEDECPDCQGTGSATPDPTADDPNPEPVSCGTCQGFRVLRFQADPKCRDLALDMAGFVSKGGVQVQQTVQVTTHSSTLSTHFTQMQEALDTVLYGAETETEAPPAVAGDVDGTILPGA